MFDHVSLKVRDFGKSLAFYRAALGPLGMEAQHVDAAGKSAGFGPPGKVGLWIGEGVPSSSIHLALAARGRAQVNAFFDAAVAAQGRDHGPAGLRTDYASDYYAAFVLDPDGNNIEAVVHEAAKPVYYIGLYDIDDPKRFAAYPPAVHALLPKYGGEILASDTAAHVVEGEGRTMSAIIRFPSKEAALGLYHDPAYQEAKAVRRGATSRITMVLAAAIE